MEKNLKGKTVIVAEDDIFLADLLAKKLQIEGANVITAATGEDCLEKITDVTPDLAIIDILLPGIDGIQTLTKIRNLENLKEMPVILLSNLEQEGYENQLKNLGKVTIIMKSDFNLDDIVKEIEKFLKK